MKIVTRGSAIAALVSQDFANAAESRSETDKFLTDGANSAKETKPLHLLHGSGLHHINVRVRNMDTAIDFYEQAFGFNLLFRWDGVEAARDGSIYFRNPLQGAHLDMGNGQILELIPAPENSIPPDDRALSFHHIALYVSNVDDTYARALAAGGKPFPIADGSGGVWDGPTDIKLKAKPPFERSFVVRAAHVHGPNEEIIELFEA